HIISGETGSDSTTRESQLKLDGFIDTGHESIRLRLRLLRRDPHWFFTHHVPGAVDGINTDVHHGAATGQFGVPPPLMRIAADKTRQPLEEPDLPELPGLSHPDHLERFWLEMH